MLASTLEKHLPGRVLTAGQPGYEQRRRVWDPRHDCYPLAVVTCRSASDVEMAIAAATEHGAAIGVRGGGHSVAGLGTIEDGLLLDLSHLRSVRVDHKRSTAIASGGCVSGDLHAATAGLRLGAVTGVSSEVGIGGLVLHGGQGFMGPRHGFSCDNVRSLTVVTPGCGTVTASADEQDELFWAARGAGANFGVVVSLELDLHPVPSTLLAGTLVFALTDPDQLFSRLSSFYDHVSDGFFAYSSFGIDEEGELVLTVPYGHIGDRAAALGELRELKQCGPALREEGELLTFENLHRRYESSTFSPLRQWWYMETTTSLADTLPVVHSIALRLLDDPALQRCSVGFFPYTHAYTTMPASPNAITDRSGCQVEILGRWTLERDDQRARDWVDAGTAQLAAAGIGTGRCFPNGMSAITEAQLRAFYGHDTFARLQRVKAEFDPDNVLRRNYNVPPA
jgi:FAD/FMN-containing dehydrogenase